MIASRIFAAYTRIASDPLSRKSGIPVIFRSVGKPGGGETPSWIDLAESYRHAIVLLVDDNMIISREWQEYLKKINELATKKGENVRLFPVATNLNSFNLSTSATNYIRLYEVEPPEVLPGSVNDRHILPDMDASKHALAATEKASGANVSASGVSQQIDLPGGGHVSIEVTINIHSGGQASEYEIGLEMEQQTSEIDREWFERKMDFLLGKLTHEFSRMVYDSFSVSGDVEAKPVAPVRLFISHAKADGKEIAEMIRNHIHSDTSLKSFFDANDIAAGYQFSEELYAAISESALICIQTDMYATREWCLWEVITAKRLDRPVVVLNAVSENEPRSFPYLGNVPTMRWNSQAANMKQQIDRSITMALFEVLNSKYHRLFEEELIRLYDLPSNTATIGHPPELFTVLKLRKAASAGNHSGDDHLLVLYPDPPLGDEEIRLLEDLAPHLRFITPTQVPSIQASNGESNV